MKRKFNPVRFFKIGNNIIFKRIRWKFPPTKKKEDKNKHNTQSLLLSCKTCNLGSPGTGFIITPILVQHGGNQKGPYLESSNNLAQNYGSYSLKFIITHLCNSSTVFGSLLRIFPLKWNLTSCSSLAISG